MLDGLLGTLNIGRCFPREATAGPDPENIIGRSGQAVAGKPKGSRETLLALSPRSTSLCLHDTLGKSEVSGSAA